MALLLPDDGLEPLSRPAAIACAVGFIAVMLHAALVPDGFVPIIDYANLMFHEAGHHVFGWASYYTVILAGTYGQLLVPLISLIFLRRGETASIAVCVFWFFQNFLNIANYMADARRSAQPLVGGDESDWAILFTHWGVLPQDLVIAGWTRGIGWVGMLATLGWVAWMYATRPAPASSS